MKEWLNGPNWLQNTEIVFQPFVDRYPEIISATQDVHNALVAAAVVTDVVDGGVLNVICIVD